MLKILLIGVFMPSILLSRDAKMLKISVKNPQNKENKTKQKWSSTLNQDVSRQP